MRLLRIAVFVVTLLGATLTSAVAPSVGAMFP